MQLGITDGWQLLAFLDFPPQALKGRPQGAAQERAIDMFKILALAVGAAH